METRSCDRSHYTRTSWLRMAEILGHVETGESVKGGIYEVSELRLRSYQRHSNSSISYPRKCRHEALRRRPEESRDKGSSEHIQIVGVVCSRTVLHIPGHGGRVLVRIEVDN